MGCVFGSYSYNKKNRLTIKMTNKIERIHTTNTGKKFKDRWYCKDCKDKMYVLKYKKVSNGLSKIGFNCKEGVCYYCKSNNLKWIGKEIK